jgi:hypothetical protein
MRYSSTELSVRHRDAYRAFFRQSEWAASSPGVFFWAGEHAVLAGSLAICQQVPLRVHVGLERISRVGDFRIEIAQGEFAHQMYDSRADAFKSFSWPSGHPGEEEPAIRSNHLSPRFMLTIKRIAQDIGLKGAYRLYSLHELRRGSAPNWSGAFSSAFAGALFSAAGQLERGHEWKEQWWDDPLLQRCNSWAWELERILHGGFASGYGVWCSTAPCAIPQLYAVQWMNSLEKGRNPADIVKEDRLADHLEAASRPLCEHSTWAQLPFDYGLIYTGKIKNTATSIRKVDQDVRQSLSKGFDLAVQNWPSSGGRPFNLQESPLFAWQQTRGPIQDISILKEALSDAITASGLRVLDAIFGISGDEAAWGHSLQDLAAAMDTVGAGIGQLGLNWPEADLIRAAVLKALWNDRHSVAVKPTGGGGGGYILFASPPLGWAEDDGRAKEGTSAALLLRELAGLQQPPLGLEVSLDWCRLRDSLDGEGLIIEVDRDDRETRVGRCPHSHPSKSPVQQPTVFICYRREDSAGHVGRLHDYLKRKNFHVFRDIDAIEPGADFRLVCQTEIRKCDVQLVVIGCHWVAARGPRGRRLDDPTDFVRQEIEIGLASSIKVIPILVNGALMPSGAELPPSIAELTALAALELPDQWWNAAVEKLARTLSTDRS